MGIAGARWHPSGVLGETSTGVYLGTMNSDYSPSSGTTSRRSSMATGVRALPERALGRAAYVLIQDLPSAWDTACSSSLVALHLALHGAAAGRV